MAALTGAIFLAPELPPPPFLAFHAFFFPFKKICAWGEVALLHQRSIHALEKLQKKHVGAFSSYGKYNFRCA